MYLAESQIVGVEGGGLACLLRGAGWWLGWARPAACAASRSAKSRRRTCLQAQPATAHILVKPEREGSQHSALWLDWPASLAALPRGLLQARCSCFINHQPAASMPGPWSFSSWKKRNVAASLCCQHHL